MILNLYFPRLFIFSTFVHILASEYSPPHDSNQKLVVSSSVVVQEDQSPVIAYQPTHELRLLEIREKMIFDSLSYFDHQTILEIEIYNIKENCSNIFYTV